MVALSRRLLKGFVRLFVQPGGLRTAHISSGAITTNETTKIQRALSGLDTVRRLHYLTRKYFLCDHTGKQT